MYQIVYIGIYSHAIIGKYPILYNSYKEAEQKLQFLKSKRIIMLPTKIIKVKKG